VSGIDVCPVGWKFVCGSCLLISNGPLTFEDVAFKYNYDYDSTKLNYYNTNFLVGGCKSYNNFSNLMVVRNGAQKMYLKDEAVAGTFPWNIWVFDQNFYFN
jgi:hypothetical protein